MRLLLSFAIVSFLSVGSISGQEHQQSINSSLIIDQATFPDVEGEDDLIVDEKGNDNAIGSGQSREEFPPFNPGDTVTVFRPAPVHAYPSVIKLVRGTFRYSEGNDNWQGEPGCTASLIHERVLLTAQHCIINDAGRMYKRISIRFRKTPSSPVHTQIINMSINNVALRVGGFSFKENGEIRWKGENDLALVLLNQPVPDAATRTVRIATQADLSNFKRLVFIGYGMQLIQISGQPPGPTRLGFLTSADVPMELTGGNFSSRLFRVRATFSISGKKVSAAVCNGDSGGPVFLARSSQPSQMVIIGVNHGVSEGYSPQACAQPGTESFLAGLIGNRNFIDAGLQKFFPG